ncbi:MAG: hypothetical protein WC519_01115 [Parcubacteria group bacterium]
MTALINKIITFVAKHFTAIADTTGTTPDDSLPSFTINPPVDIGGNLDEILNKAISILTPVVLTVAGAMYLYAGFLFLTSGGKEENVSKAKKTLLWTTIGVAATVLAGTIVYAVKEIFGA